MYDQVKHSFASPFVIKINKETKGRKNSIWYQYSVVKIDSGALLAVTPPIRPKTSRTINDKFVKQNKIAIKDFELNRFELSFSNPAAAAAAIAAAAAAAATSGGSSSGEVLTPRRATFPEPTAPRLNLSGRSMSCS